MSNKDFHQYDDTQWFLEDRPKSNNRSHKLFNWDHVEPVLSVVPAFQNVSLLKMNSRVHQDFLTLLRTQEDVEPWMHTLMERLVRFYPGQPKEYPPNSRFYLDREFQDIFTLKMNESCIKDLGKELSECRNRSPLLNSIVKSLTKEIPEQEFHFESESKVRRSKALTNWDDLSPIFNLDFLFDNVSVLKMNPKVHQEVLMLLRDTENRDVWMNELMQELVNFYPQEFFDGHFSEPKFVLDDYFQDIAILKMNSDCVTTLGEELEELNESPSELLQKVIHYMDKAINGNTNRY